MKTRYFKTVSIIMLIFGILGLIGGVGSLTGGGVNRIAVILALVTNLLLIVGGFVGNSAAKTGEKGPLCRTLSYILLAVALISLVIGFVLNKSTPVPEGVSPSLVTGITLIGSIISLILPVLYFLGARKLGK